MALLRRLAPAALAAALCSGAAAAAGRVSLEAGGLELDGLSIEGLEVVVAPAAAAAGSVRLRAARVRGLAATGPLSRFALDCPDLRVLGDELRCDRGRLSGSLGSLGVQDTRFAARRLAGGGIRL